jgi:hypothetical protein
MNDHQERHHEHEGYDHDDGESTGSWSHLKIFLSCDVTECKYVLLGT